MAVKDPDIATVEYKGARYEVSRSALLSMKVNRAMVNAEKDIKAAYAAMDAICRGNLDRYLDTLPEADGTVNPYGASAEAFNQFLEAAAEQVRAKN